MTDLPRKAARTLNVLLEVFGRLPRLGPSPGDVALAQTRAAFGDDLVLRLDRVHQVFAVRGQRVVALDDFSLDIRRGEFLTIVGPSGCGKSTLLNVLVGLQPPTAGSIIYAGSAWPPGRINSAIGYVTQDDNLLPWRTLQSNVEFGMEVRKDRRFSRHQRAAVADRLIREVGLAGFERHYRHELSGGMRQRANIIRTLSYEPSIILMDEPFGPLDAQTRIQLQGVLLGLWQHRPGTTIVFITHDLAEAVALADRLVVMTRRPGRIKAVFDINIPRPRDIYQLQTSETFHRLYDRVWKVLEDEMREEANGGG
jgi:NitT/TauT family transport system ATP-binding protein